MQRLAAPFRAAFVVFAVASLLVAGQGNAAIGAWKLNIAASDYGSVTAPKSGMLTVQAHGDGVSFSYELVEQDGSTVKYGYEGNFDRKDDPISGSGTTSWREDLVNGADSIALTSFGSNASGAVLKKSGNVVSTTRTVVSKNGKAMTITINAADAKGRPIKTVTIWDKQ